MSKDSLQIFVAIDANIFIGDPGADEPDNTWDFAADSLTDIGWHEMGWNTKDGVSLTFGRTTTNIEGQGSIDPLRVLVTAAPKSLGFTLEELSLTTWDFATGGATSEEIATGLYEILPTPASQLQEKALGVLFTDGEKHLLNMYRRGTLSGDTTVPFVDGNASLMPITYQALNPGSDLEVYRTLADFDAMAPVGS
jgi:hypothetical protein